MPEADQLLGKPIPIVAVQRIFERADASSASALQHKIQWLIDTPERLEQYEAFAELWFEPAHQRDRRRPSPRLGQ